MDSVTFSDVHSLASQPHSSEPTEVEIWDAGSKLGTAIVSGSSWSFTANGLATGRHSFSARSGSLISNNWVIDVSSVIPAIVSATDGVGTPLVENEGNESEVVLLSGTGAPGTNLIISDQFSPLETAVVGADGKWSARLTGLSVGSHTCRATVSGSPTLSNVWRVVVLPPLNAFTNFVDNTWGGWETRPALASSTYAWDTANNRPCRIMYLAAGTGQMILQAFSGLKVGARYSVSIVVNDAFPNTPPTPQRPFAIVAFASNPPGLTGQIQVNKVALTPFSANFIATAKTHQISLDLNTPGSVPKSFALYEVAVRRL